MAKKIKMRKPANATGLNSDKPSDVKAIKCLRELAEVLPGCSDVTSALRWLCENEAPKVAERFTKMLQAG